MIASPSLNETHCWVLLNNGLVWLWANLRFLTFQLFHWRCQLGCCLVFYTGQFWSPFQARCADLNKPKLFLLSASAHAIFCIWITFLVTDFVLNKLQLAATAAFLIARYFARDRILKVAQNNPKFLAIDKAVGADGFRVVTLLRLSPLLPFSLGNYLYRLTSIELGPYVLGRYSILRHTNT